MRARNSTSAFGGLASLRSVTQQRIKSFVSLAQIPLRRTSDMRQPLSEITFMFPHFLEDPEEKLSKCISFNTLLWNNKEVIKDCEKNLWDR